MYRRTKVRKYKRKEVLLFDPVIKHLDSDVVETLNLDLVTKPLDPDLCLICLEIDQETNKLFKMKDIAFLNSECKCNSNLHVNCLVNWLNVSKTCPICRKELTINLDILNQVNQMYRTNIMIQFKNNLSNIIFIFVTIVMVVRKYFIFFIFIKGSYYIVKHLLHNSENRG